MVPPASPSTQRSGRILVTGGTGSLGRALLGRAHREGWPARLVVVSRDAGKCAALERELSGIRAVTLDLGSPAGGQALARLLAEERIDTLIHAAAEKQVPVAERHVADAVRANVTASTHVARAAVEAGVARVVGVSTDKACSPASVYGLTKALMERLFAEADTFGSTRFVCLRCSNVIGSSGSAALLFFRQLAENGTIRVTDRRMTRFALSLAEAVDLVWLCADLAVEIPGATLLPRYPAYRIDDLSEAVWLERGGSGPPPVEVTGLRPGERLFDLLWDEGDAPRLAAFGDHPYLKPGGTTPALDGALPPRYSSEAPVRWLTVSELRRMINEARATQKEPKE